MPDKIMLRISKQTLQSLGCNELNSLINLLNYACTVRGNQDACRDLEYVRSIATSKGCTV